MALGLKNLTNMAFISEVHHINVRILNSYKENDMDCRN